jgi:propionate CoA-transferase
MELRDEMLRLPFDARFSYDEEHNTLFLNLSELAVKSLSMIERYRDKIRGILEPLGHKVYAVINYDGFELDRSIDDAFYDAVKEIGDRYFHGVTRFTTSAFMRAKLGERLSQRGVGPHIFESEDEAKAAVRATVQHRT